LKLFRWLWRFLVRDPDEVGEEGPIEASLQFGCFILTIFAALFVGLVVLSR